MQPGCVAGDISKQGQRAYFKGLASGHGQFPHGVLDCVGWTVGSIAGSPVADLRAVELIDKTRGIASLLPPQPFAVWANFPAAMSVPDTIERFGGPRSFAALLVFDVWLGNMDRHDRNLVYRELNPQSWELVLIDHGHIFANGQWANNLADFNTPVAAGNLATAPFIRQDNARLASVFNTLIRDHGLMLRQIAEEFSGIGDDTISAGILEIPNEFATDAQLAAISQIINLRKNRLGDIFLG